MSSRFFISGALFASFCLTSIAGPAFAQDAELPQSLLETTRRMQGEQLIFCTDPMSVGGPFDRKVAQSIADALLVTPVFDDLPTGFALGGGGYLAELQIAMNNSCDVAMGFSLAPDSAFPSWVTFTRPYAQVPFVVAAINPDYASLGDVPKDKTIGTAMGSLGENTFITYNRQQAKADQWRRLPYANFDLMLKRLKDGSLDAMILWDPSLTKATGGDPAAQGVKLLDPSPMQPSKVDLGAIVSNRDSFLRSQVDEAIGALISDGTIARLMAEEGYAGTPGP